jgi:enolase
MDTLIDDVVGRQILDSRGNPTVEVEVALADGSVGRAAVPSGASTGVHEALELRDGDKKRLPGQGRPESGRERQRADCRELFGVDATRPDVHRPDAADLDGTPNKSRWAPTPSWASPGRGQGRADELGMPLYRYMGGVNAHVLPVPMMNILNGGKHAWQQHRLARVHGHARRRLLRRGLRWGAEIYHSLKGCWRARATHQRGRRGRLCPLAGLQRRGHRSDPGGHRARRLQGPARTSSIALDPASSEFYDDGKRTTWPARAQAPATRWSIFLADWVGKYPIISIEDGMAEDDWEGWVKLVTAMGDRCRSSATTCW